MEQLLASIAGLAPEVRAQLLQAHHAALAAVRDKEVAALAAVAERVRSLRGDVAVEALLSCISQQQVTKHNLKRALDAALAAIDGVDDGNSHEVSDFRDKLHGVLSKLGDSGYASNKVKTDVQHALDKFGVQMPEEAQPALIAWNGESGDEDEDEEDEDPASTTGPDEAPVERAQAPPSVGDPDVVKEAFRLIMSSSMMRGTIRFDLAPFLLRVHDNVLAAQAKAAGEGSGVLPPVETIKMFGGGRTQARKTPLKAAQFVLCRMMGVPTLLLTTNVAGREDLFRKFGVLLVEIDVPTPPQCAGQAKYAGTQYEYQKVNGVQKLVASGREVGPRGMQGLLSVDTIAQQHRSWAVSQLQLGACIICNNTAAAIDKVSSLVREARGGSPGSPLQFVLTIDEADDFYRTDGDCHQPIKLELALDGLKDLSPLVCFEVSATLLAVYMALHREGGADAVAAADLWYVEPCDDYVGADLLMPPLDPRGQYQFLFEDDLKKSNKFADPKVRSVYADAAAHPRSLLLDATTASVTAANQIGIFDKARLVQTLHPHAIVVVVSGSLIKWWTVNPQPNRPQDYNGTELLGKARVVGNVIAKIDRYYPDRPIFVFGYSQMVRGVSYRSRHRVPSHFVLLYKSGMPLCRLVQAAGRAMGEQARQLHANGFNHVVMLTQPQDYDAICAYPEFLKAIKQQMEDGTSLADALGATYQAKYNCFSTPKELGAKKLHLDSFVQQTLHFAPTTEPIGMGNAQLDAELGSEGRGLRRAVLEVLLEMGCLDDEYAMGGKDVLEELKTGEYDEFFGDVETELTTAEVTKVLKELCYKPAHREPVLDSNGRVGKALKFFVNEEGLDALPGRMSVPAAPQALVQATVPSDDDSVDVDQSVDDGGPTAPVVAEVLLPRRETSVERMTRRERELQAAQAAAEETQVASGAIPSGAGPSGAVSPPMMARAMPPVGTGGRPRRNAAVAAAIRVASCASQLAMDESCDERPEDRLPLGKRPCQRGSP